VKTVIENILWWYIMSIFVWVSNTWI
jgi:hypothetical protein